MSQLSWSEPQNDSVELPGLSVISVWFGLVFVALTAVSTLTHKPGQPNGWQPILIFLQYILIALIFSSFLLLAASRNRRLAAMPLIINLGTLLIVQTVPFDGLWQEMSFRWRWRTYQEIAAKIEAGEVAVEDGLVTLPPQYRHVTADGRILIDRHDGITRIFFFTEWASSQRYAGYFYRSDGKPPQPDDFGGQWHYITRKRPYWYFCISTP